MIHAFIHLASAIQGAAHVISRQLCVTLDFTNEIGSIAPHQAQINFYTRTVDRTFSPHPP